jgi:hypothetical protein
MARYWIADARRNILGPVDERVLADLAAAGKLSQIELVSKDGGAWAPPQSFSEIAGLFVEAISHAGDDAALARIKGRVLALAKRFPLYGRP